MRSQPLGTRVGRVVVGCIPDGAEVTQQGRVGHCSFSTVLEDTKVGVGADHTLCTGSGMPHRQNVTLESGLHLSSQTR